MSLLSDKQKAFYAENGYLVLDEFFTKDECARLRQDADEAAEGRFTNILDLHKRRESFHNLIISQKLLPVLDELQGARMIPIGSIFFYCKPNNALENGSNPHQDNYAAKAPVGSYLVVGVAIDDADASYGALVVYPRIHQLGDLPNTPSKNFEKDAQGNIIKANPIGNKVEIPEGYEPVQLSYKAGSVILLHGHNVHAAPKNEHPTRWRRTIYLHYIKDGDPFWPGWNARRQIMDRDAVFAAH
jgi:ectoine hydroxylase-related dioxygenase (phytanoyl-CoA dioxygenase family)